MYMKTQAVSESSGRAMAGTKTFSIENKEVAIALQRLQEEQ
jgi:hypothetical protein